VPSQVLRPCRYGPGCTKLVPGGGYCPKHQIKWRQAPQHDSAKSTGERGYDWKWQKCRQSYVAKHPICQVCGSEITRMVHHKVPIDEAPELRLDHSNLVGVCSESCHRKAERTEMIPRVTA